MALKEQYTRLSSDLQTRRDRNTEKDTERDTERERTKRVIILLILFLQVKRHPW